MTDLHTLSALEVAELVRARQVSAVDVTRAALERADALSERVGAFEERPIVMAVLGDPYVASQIRDSVLGGLDRMPEGERAVLLETFEKWLDAGGSSRAAAKTLFCHPNTVRNRLRRLEEATGRLLRRPRDVAELCLALAAERGAL